MAIFDRLDRMTSRAIDRINGVHFECQPGKANPNGRPMADPDRPIWEGKGVLTEQPVYDAIEMGKRGQRSNDFYSLATGQVTELSVDRDPLRNPGADTTEQGDRIRLDDGREYEVSTVRRDGLSRVVFQLVAIRS